jgi:hypothetical protein
MLFCLSAEIHISTEEPAQDQSAEGTYSQIGVIDQRDGLSLREGHFVDFFSTLMAC